MIRLFLTAALLCAASIAYTSNYEMLQGKAMRFFAHREWASASAMYVLMLDQKPTQCDTYGHAIVSAGMRNDTLQQLSLMRQSIKALIPFDSIFGNVKSVSFKIGNSDLYEQFLLLVQRSEPWMSRSIDRYLLDYYTFRNDAPKMIIYSRRMLTGLPDDTRFLSTLAKGYMLNSQTPEAIVTYERILDVDPDNYNALLQLGNYYDITAQSDAAREKAIGYLQKAHSLNPTPYIHEAIKRLKAATNQ